MGWLARSLLDLFAKEVRHAAYAASSMCNRSGGISVNSFVRITYRVVGLVVKASASRAEDPEIESRRDFSGSSHTCDLKIGTPVATLPGVIGSALGLVGPVSAYCDWARWKV